MTIALLLLTQPAGAAGVHVTSTRVWPAADYTRVTIESRLPIQHKFFSLDSPERLVLDLDEVVLSAALNEVAGKISADDPYIKGVRVARFKPGTIRLVFDLKTKVKPETFALAPVGEYGHRLVLDVYPLEPPDPLLAFLKERETPAAGTPPARQFRLVAPPPAAATGNSAAR